MHAKTPWAQGRLLDTAQTRRYHKQGREIAEAREKLCVYSNFSSLDEGKSREFVCECRNPEDAALIACAVTAFDAMKAALIDLEWSNSGRCPQCNNKLIESHQPKCILAIALNLAEEPK